MDQETYDNLDGYDRKLYNYVHEEMNIYDEETFQILRHRYANKQSATAYRGMNFSTEEAYNKFIEKVKEEGGFKAGSAAGFSRCLETAEDFAMTVKTYFPTYEVMLEESVRNLTGEKITGFKGVVVEIEIPEGDGIDTHESEFGIEDEILIKPGSLYKCKINPVLSYKEKVENININEYIMNLPEEGLHKDSLMKYIIINKTDLLSEEVQDRLFKSALFKKEKFDDGFKHGGFDLVEARDNLAIYTEYKYERLSDEEGYEETNFIVPDFFQYDLYGVFSDEKRKEMQKIADNILFDVMDYYVSNKNERYNMTNLRYLTGYASEETISLFKRMSSEISNRFGNYNDLQEELIDKVNNKANTSEEKRKAIDEGAEKIKRYLETLIVNLPIDREILNKERIALKKRREDAIEKLANTNRKRRF